MKNIYTSNYERNGSNPNAIGISLIVPEGFEGIALGYLAPSSTMLSKFKRSKRDYDKRRYSREYIDLLKSRNVNPNKLILELPDNAILLCYEPPNEFCHRRVLADWISYHTDVIIDEWKTKEELEEEEQNKVVDSIIDF